MVFAQRSGRDNDFDLRSIHSHKKAVNDVRRWLTVHKSNCDWSKALIHQTAIVDPSAEIADDVSIGPYSIIGPQVKIGPGCKIGPHVVLNGPTVLGARNTIYQFASVGEACQDKKYNGEPTTLVIGDDNVIREYVTLQRGTVQDRGETLIGDRNLFMAYVHVGHDCVVGSDTVFANNATLAGHVSIGDGVILGGFTAVLQRCRIGRYAMTAMCTAVNGDVPAFVMAQGNLAQPRGMNVEGMRRRGYSKALIASLVKAYKTVFRQGHRLEDAIKMLQADLEQSPELDWFIESLQAGQRGVIR